MNDCTVGEMAEGFVVAPKMLLVKGFVVVEDAAKAGIRGTVGALLSEPIPLLELAGERAAEAGSTPVVALGKKLFGNVPDDLEGVSNDDAGKVAGAPVVEFGPRLDVSAFAKSNAELMPVVVVGVVVLAKELNVVEGAPNVGTFAA